MTPPRSEAWSIILGAGLAMLWYMAREKRNSAIRVAIFTAIGGGFGFAFGNFLQVIGHVMEIQFNMWNVMEYSIGFFGGSAMAYGVYSSKWPVDETLPKKWANRAALFIIVILIPLIIYRESLAYEYFMKRLGEIINLDSVATLSTTFVAIVLVLMSSILFWKLKDGKYKKKDISLFFFVYLAVYILISYMVTGLFAGKMELNHHLYILNIIVIFMLVRNERLAMFELVSDKVNSKRWLTYLIVVLLFIALLAVIAINSHGEIGGAHNRFPVN